ncbi:alpha/beta fold hydrolase [Streptomyces sp. NPDC050560]|uniref:alpha/beta fold hydrolase n=1 Tax=Streptomyces sp. NPDC050560 TaxID=3365630 RepID=UPI0037A05C87
MPGSDRNARTVTLTTSDASLAYRDEGSGRPLVLLHGGFLDSTMWDEQVRAFAPRHRVVAVDARGHGATSNATGPFRAADDVAALLRHLDAGPAVLVGLSMGGGTAVDVVLEHPDLVRAVVVSGVGTSEPAFEDPWTLDVFARQQRALAAGDIEAVADAFLDFVAGPHRPLDEVGKDVVRRVREMTLRTLAKHTGDEPDHRVPVRDTWRRARGIGVPVLAINGAVDSPDHLGMADRLVRTVPRGRATAIPDTAHYPNMEAPAQFDAALTDFLAGLPD